VRIDLGRGARVEILEEVGEVVAGERRRVDFGSQRLEEPGETLAIVTLPVPICPVPFRQASNLNGELFERVGCGILRANWAVMAIVILLHKDIGAGCFVLFDNRACFQRVQHIRYMGALEGARATAGLRAFGRRVEAGEGPRGMEVAGAWWGHCGQGGCYSMSVWLSSVS
jgi:hypothetical protein